MAQELAKLVEIEHATAVRFTRVFTVGDWALWKLLTERDLVKQWFPQEYTFEPWGGGEIQFHSDEAEGLEEGVIVQHEAPHHLVFTWGENEISYYVEPLDDDNVRFYLQDTLAHPNEAARNAAGWELCLADLERLTKGQTPALFDMDEWKRHYAAYQQAGFASGADVPGLDE